MEWSKGQYQAISKETYSNQVPSYYFQEDKYINLKVQKGKY